MDKLTVKRFNEIRKETPLYMFTMSSVYYRDLIKYYESDWITFNKILPRVISITGGINSLLVPKRNYRKAILKTTIHGVTVYIIHKVYKSNWCHTYLLAVQEGATNGRR